MVAVTLRALSEDDFPALATWVQAEHVQEWWRDDGSLDAVREQYGPCVTGIDPTEVFVIVSGGEDLGIVQRYRVAAHSEWRDTLERTGLALPDAAGLDYLIGVPSRIGQGIGTEAVARCSALTFADWLDIERIVVTPQAANRASCRVLEHAGYALRWTGQLESSDPSDFGPSALYVLERPSAR
ncbi:MAG: GNAT family N-acetyltransferase, partial [Acidimicrobiia bacterium]